MTARAWVTSGPRGRRAAALALTMVVGATFGCSSGDESASRTDPTGVPERVDARFAPIARWGDGRAVAVDVADHITTVVTTTGVFLQPSGEPLERVVEWSGGVEFGPLLTELDPDGQHLAIATTSDLRIVDLESRLETRIPLPQGASVSQLLAGADGWVLNTSDGVLVAPTGGGELTPVAAGRIASGRLAVDRGRLVIPLANSNLITVVDGGSSENVELALTDGTFVLDASVSLGGELAVSSGVGPDSFDRMDEINLVGPDGVVAATIDAGQPLEPRSWLVTDDAVVAASDRQLEVWARDGTPISGMEHPTTQPVRSVHQIDGAVLVVHADGSMVSWSPTDWSPHVITSGGTTVTDIDVAPDGSRFASVDFHGRVAVRSAEPGVAGTEVLQFAVGEATAVAIAADGGVAVTTSMGDAYLLDEALEERDRVRPSDGAERIGSVTFDTTAETVVVGIAQRIGDIAFDDSVVGYDTGAGDEIYRLGGEGEDVAGCAFFNSRVLVSPDGRFLASSSHDFAVVLSDPLTGDEIRVIEGPTAVLDVAFTDSGDRLIITYDAAHVAVYSTEDFALVGEYQVPMGGYQAIVPLGGGELAAADVTGAVQVIDAETGAARRQLGSAGLRTSVLAASPEGRLVASPTTKGEIVVWAASTGEELARLAGHTAEVTGLAFSDDGSVLASSSRDGTARSWSIELTRDA